MTFDGQGAERCSANIIEANPSFEAVALASALDVTQTASEGLGELFAQTVQVSCR